MRRESGEEEGASSTRTPGLLQQLTPGIALLPLPRNLIPLASRGLPEVSTVLSPRAGSAEGRVWAFSGRSTADVIGRR